MCAWKLLYHWEKRRGKQNFKRLMFNVFRVLPGNERKDKKEGEFIKKD